MIHLRRLIDSMIQQWQGIVLFLLISLIINHPSILAENLVKPVGNGTGVGKVLSPNKFVGKVSVGYKAAQTIPEICGKLFCYCGCDLTDNHTSLLDCFTCEHGMDCDVCLDEAILALHLKEQGKSLAEIQKTIDAGFAALYPWDKPSSALIKYRTAYKLSHDSSDTISGAMSTKTNKQKQAGKCCGHK